VVLKKICQLDIRCLIFQRNQKQVQENLNIWISGRKKSKPAICNLSSPKFTNQCLYVVCAVFKFHSSTDVHHTVLRQTSASWQGRGFSNRLTRVRVIFATARLRVAAPQAENWPRIRDNHRLQWPNPYNQWKTLHLNHTAWQGLIWWSAEK